jgi:hypothetical protein
MSAITETEPGGELVCIVAFSARPRDSENRSLPAPRREFRVGEHVRFVRTFYKDTPSDNPVGRMVIFESPGDDGHGQYTAVQSYFVSLDGWASLARYFREAAPAKKVRGSRVKASEHGRPKASRPRP